MIRAQHIWLVVAASWAHGGCLIIKSDGARAPADDQPSRWQAGVHTRAGISSVSDDEFAAPSGPAATIGGHAFAAYRLAQRWTAGLAIDFQYSSHDNNEDAYRATSYLYGTWALTTRVELQRLTATTWAGWYFGRRALSMPNAIDSGDATDLNGPAAGAALLYRLPFGNRRAIEVGPYVHGAWLETGSDTEPLVAAGRSVLPLSGGVLLQVVFGVAGK